MVLKSILAYILNRQKVVSLFTVLGEFTLSSFKEHLHWCIQILCTVMDRHNAFRYCLNTIPKFKCTHIIVNDKLQIRKNK